MLIKEWKGKVDKQCICHKTKSSCFNNCEKSMTNFLLIIYNYEIKYFHIYETNPSVENLFMQYYRPNHEYD